MRTQDVERAIVQCKKFFVSPVHGRAVYTYDDIRAVMVSNKVDGVEKVDNKMLGRMISRFGGFVLNQTVIDGKPTSTVQAMPERIKKLRQLVSCYVNKPSTMRNGGRMCHPSKMYVGKKATF